MFRATRAWMLVVGLAVSSVGMVVAAGDVAATSAGGGPTGLAAPGEDSSGVMPVGDAEVVEGEYVVQFAPSASGNTDGDAEVQGNRVEDLHARVERVMSLLAATSSSAPSGQRADAVTDQVIGELGIIDGFAARLSPASAERLAQMPGVAVVYPNTVVSGDATPPDPTWGLDRIDQQALPLDGSYTAPNDGAGTHIYVVDQAILPTHVEFAGRLGDGVDTVGTPLDEPYCFDHGTHVAGTAGGANVGVAPAATLHSVRVLGCANTGSVVSILLGLDWVATNAERPAVVNMSLGGPGLQAFLTTAVDHLAVLGITSVVAAGNSSDDACKFGPAAAPRALTVAASDRNDAAATDFSNFGSCVDLYAPGVDVISASYTGPDDYAAQSGTSMAAPHVAGAVATYLHDYPQATPAQVHEAIASGAAVNQITAVPAQTPNRLLNVQALPEPGGGGPVVDEPIAYVVPVPTQTWGTKTVFDGSQSSDPAGGALTYAWTVDNSPEVVGTGPTFDYWNLERGIHVVLLTVTNAAGQSNRAVLPFQVEVPDPMLDPVAKLSPSSAFQVAAGREVAFDATRSYSPFGIELEYSYLIVDLSTFELVAAGDSPTFTFTFPTDGGSYVVLADVEDEYRRRSRAVTEVTVSSEPTDVATIIPGDPQKVPTGKPVTFDGSLSGYHLGSPEFENRTFEWTQSAVGVVSTEPSLTKTFDTPGPITLDLTVKSTNGDGAPVPDARAAVPVEVVASAPPTVVLNSSDIEVELGEVVTISGIESADPDGGPVDAEWTVSDDPGAVASTDIVFGRVFDTPGQYDITLALTDDEGETTTKSVSVSVAPRPTSPPVASFTPETTQRIVVGQSLSFDGSASFDPDGGALTYQWRSTGLPGIASGTSSFSREFTDPGRYGVELVVIDDEGDRAKQRVNVWVAEPKPPVASFTPGTDQYVSVGQSLSFDGSASNDPDGGALTYQWRSTGLPGIASGTSSFSRKFTAPGRYGVELVVIDDEGQRAKLHINVWVAEPKPPVATFTPGVDQRIVVGQTVRFDGTASKDPDGGALTYQWRSTGVPGIASGATRYSRKFTEPGRYGVELVVIDDEGQRAKLHINVWVSKR